MKIKHLYFLFLLAGLVLPMSQFLKFLLKYGLNIRYFLELIAANYVSRFFVLDLVIAAGIFIVFVIVEGRRTGMRHIWVYILSTFCIGLSFSFPLFLYFREDYKKRPLNSES